MGTEEISRNGNYRALRDADGVLGVWLRHISNLVCRLEWMALDSSSCLTSSQVLGLQACGIRLCLST